MNIKEALDQIINRGIEAVKRDYKENTDKYNGSIAGFEECRNKSPQELKTLLDKCREDTHKIQVTYATHNIIEGYWFVRCFELEVEWVCNVLSAILMNNGMPIIITPTCRGVMMAAEIVGVKDKS